MRNEDQLNKNVNPMPSAQGDEPRGQEEEEYAFIRETHKKRPLSFRNIFNIFCCLVASGLVFGTAAGLVFNSITGIYSQKTPSTVTIPSDELTADGSASAAVGDGSSSSEKPGMAGNSGTGSAAATDRSSGADSGKTGEAPSAEPTGKTDSSREGNRTESSASSGADSGESGESLSTEPADQSGDSGTGAAAGSGSTSDADCGETGNKSGSEPKDNKEGSGAKGGENSKSAKEDQSEGDGEEKSVIGVTPTPELTEEERRAEVIDNYKEVQAAFAGVARQAMYSMVTVTGYTSEEDWFNTTSLSSKEISGVIIADNGVDLLVLVEYRAIENSERIVVTFADGSLADATLQMADPTTGFAVVCVPLENITEATMGIIEPAVLGNSFKVMQGDVAIVVGKPSGQAGAFIFGLVTSMGNTVSLEDASYELISTDMYGSDKGSGVLLNSDGEVIGLLSTYFSVGDPAVLDAVPISLVKSLIEHLSNKTPLARTGIYGTDISTGISQLYDLPAGIYVTALSEESPAFEAGIRVADIITMVDGKAITSMRAYHEKLMEMAPDATLEVTVERSGSDGMVEYTYTVVVGELA